MSDKAFIITKASSAERWQETHYLTQDFCQVEPRGPIRGTSFLGCWKKFAFRAYFHKAFLALVCSYTLLKFKQQNYLVNFKLSGRKTFSMRCILKCWCSSTRQAAHWSSKSKRSWQRVIPYFEAKKSKYENWNWSFEELIYPDTDTTQPHAKMHTYWPRIWS